MGFHPDSKIWPEESGLINQKINFNMKILAIEKETEGVSWKNQDVLLRSEAQYVYKLYLSEYIREIYFTQNRSAVLILEANGINEAAELLGSLPLVKSGMITFEIFELKPYTGFDRLMNLNSD